MKVSSPSSVIETDAPAREAVLGRDDERQRVGVDHLGDQAIVAGVVAGDAELEVPLEQLDGDAARLRAPDLDLDLGVEAAGSAGCAAAGRASTIRWRRRPGARPTCRAARPARRPAPPRGSGSGARSRARCARCRSGPVLGGAVDQLLAELGLEPLHRQRDRGLRAEQLLGGAREAALADDRREDLQGVELHRAAW